MHWLPRAICSVYTHDDIGAMTPFQRGVSDLGCGRGRDRRRGQIPWSLTPRSPRWRGNDRGDGERSATHADRVLGTRSLHRTSTCNGRQKSVKGDWLESDRRGTSQEGGNTSRWALFPSLFPPSEVSRLWFREPQNRVRRGSEPAAGDLVGGDDAIFFQFANS